MPEIASLYETDFYEWSNVQADHIKNKRFSEIDIENLIEEIESLGISNKTTLRSQLNRLLMHLLKEKYQPEKNYSNSWRSSIIDAKREILYITDHSPSLKNFLLVIFPKSYKDARKYASEETNLDIKTFPEECPWEFYELFVELKKK